MRDLGVPPHLEVARVSSIPKKADVEFRVKTTSNVGSAVTAISLADEIDRRRSSEIRLGRWRNPADCGTKNSPRDCNSIGSNASTAVVVGGEVFTRRPLVSSRIATLDVTTAALVDAPSYPMPLGMYRMYTQK